MNSGQQTTLKNFNFFQNKDFEISCKLIQEYIKDAIEYGIKVKPTNKRLIAIVKFYLI